VSIIEVQAPGLLTTVQDLGREGFGPMGVSPSGAADPVAMRLGNRLVGNPESAAALEMTLLGGTFVFPQGALVALTGADFGAELDDSAIPLWSSIQVRPGQTLRTGATRSGARCYLCLRGGIDVRPFLGSRSTHLLSALGGHEGRALRKGDILQIGAAKTSFRTKKIAAKYVSRLQPRKVLRVTPGPQCDAFSDLARKSFFSTTYNVAEESNRIGLRLQGTPLPASVTSVATPAAGDLAELMTEGVPLGAVQIPPSGLPIILFVEQQTTGGYAKIANVISADLSSVGQLRPRDQIRFEPVDWENARALLLEQEALLASEELIV